MHKIALIGLLLTSCYSTPNPLEPFEDSSSCLGPYFVKNNTGTLNSDVLRQEERKLKYLFTHSWAYTTIDGGFYERQALLKDEKEFCDSFGGIRTTFEWQTEFACGSAVPNTDCWGLTTLGQGIFLEYSGRAWAHELIHVYEAEHGILDSAKHPNWDQKGYYYLNDDLWYFLNNDNVMTGPDGGVAPSP